MIKILKAVAVASILSIGSSQAFADSNIDTGKISECPAFSAALTTIKNQLGGNAGNIVGKVQDAFNSGGVQAACNLATASTDVDFWVDYYRLKINTTARHFHFRIKPKVGSTIKVDANF